MMGPACEGKETMDLKQSTRTRVGRPNGPMIRFQGQHIHGLQEALAPSLGEKWRAAGDFGSMVRHTVPRRAPTVHGTTPLRSFVDTVKAYVQFANPNNYALGDHIYSVKTGDMLSYALGPHETPVLPSCRLGQLFHADLYGCDPTVLTRALEQVARHSQVVIVALSRPGEARTREFAFQL